MDERFYESWFNRRHRVLGRWLHPFCLSDALILSVAGSPFLLGREPGLRYTLADLQVAVQICSTPAALYFEARLGTGGFWERLRLCLWTRRYVGELESQCQAFVGYLDDFNAPPEVWRDEDTPETGGMRAPWVLANAVFLMRHTTYRPAEIWAMPLGQALWLAATISEQNGSKLELVTPEEQAAIEAMGL